MIGRFLKRFIKKKQPYVLKGKYDLSYYVDPLSALDYHIVQHGILQDWIAINLNKIVDKKGIVLDIGANSGLLTLPFAKEHVPDGKVYAFEPDIENYKQLENNIALNSLKNITPELMALQDDPSIETVNFFQRRAIDGDKLINRGLSTLEPIALHQTSTYTVRCSTIDHFVEQNNLTSLDFIKIDVEGSEYKVLKGGSESIGKFLPSLQYEYSTTIDNLTNSNNTEQSFCFLDELDFVQFIIHNEKSLIQLNRYDSNLKDCNVLAIHRTNKHILERFSPLADID